MAWTYLIVVITLHVNVFALDPQDLVWFKFAQFSYEIQDESATQFADNISPIYHVTCGQCMSVCSTRKGCMLVNYRRFIQQCRLISQQEKDELPVVTEQTGSMLVEKENIDATSVPAQCERCGNDQTCDKAIGRCKTVECPKPNLDGGQVYGNVRAVGSRLVLACDAGNDVIKLKSVTCRADGAWSRNPTCIADGCSEPPPIPNAVRTIRLNGLHMAYSCDVSKKYYDIDGKDEVTIKCDVRTGKWADPDIKCVKGCGLPPVFEHGTFGAVGTHVVNDMLELTCDVTYTRSTAFVDEASITCQEDGEWSTTSAHCVESCQSAGTAFMMSLFKNSGGKGERYLVVVATETTKMQIKIPFINYDAEMDVYSYIAIYLDLLPDLEHSEVSKKAIHVKTDKPVHVFLYQYKTLSAEGTLVLPESCASKEYILITHDAGGVDYPGGQSVVVALNDDTDVTITEHGTGVTNTIVLNRYDVWHYTAEDLTGATVSASNNIVVFAGHRCAMVPNTACDWCDLLLEQMPPLSSLSTAYVVTYQMPRPDFSLRVVASQDNTDVIIWNVGGGIIRTSTLDKMESYFDSFVNFATISVTANKPILVAQYSHGGKCDDVGGDPAFVVIPSLTQFLTEYSLIIDPTPFPNNFLSLIIRKDDDISGLRLNAKALTPSAVTTVTVTGVGLYHVVHQDLSALNTATTVLLTHVKGTVEFGVVQYGFIFALKKRAAYSLVPGRNTPVY